MPITAIVLLLSFTLAPEMPVGTLVMFLLGAILLIVGMGLFSLGADMAMMPMGDGVGGEVVRMGKRSIWPILPIVFLIGSGPWRIWVSPERKIVSFHPGGGISKAGVSHSGAVFAVCGPLCRRAVPVSITVEV